MYGVKAEAGGELVASNVLVVDDAAGPGVPVDRSPPWGVLVGIVLGVAGLLLVLRLQIGRAQARRPQVAATRTRD